MAAAEAGLAGFGLKDTVEGRRRFVRRLDERACAEKPTESGLPPLDPEVDARLSHLQRGWYWGSQEFAERLLKLGSEAIGKKRERGYQYSAERRAHDEGEAERLLKTGLAAAGMGDAEVEQLPGADARKVAIANWIWSRTAVSQAWLAERLGMASAANVSYLIRRWKQRKKKPKLPVDLARILSDPVAFSESRCQGAWRAIVSR